MIKIQRTSCPTSLNKSDEGFVENDYKNQDVIRSLLNMQNSKCCYCEKSLRGDTGKSERWVDHYRPRTSFRDASDNIQWHLANRWENLLYTCPTCGGAKSSKNPFNMITGEREIIDPSLVDTDPEDHIDFCIDGVVVDYIEKGGSALGRSTISKLNLSARTELIGEFRKIKAEVEFSFAELINALVGEDIQSIKQQKNELSRFMSAHQPFAAFKRNFISRRLNELNRNDIPKLEAKYGRSFDRIEVEFPVGYEIKT